MMRDPNPARATAAQASGPAPYQLLGAGQKVKRVPLALGITSLAACIVVALIGGLLFWGGMMIMSLPGLEGVLSRDRFGTGVQTALTLCMLNFVLFFIVVPVTWLVLGLSIGRMPHRRIARRGPYLRWTAIWGAVLTGLTTAAFASTSGTVSALGGLITGAIIGALAGFVCGYIFYAIVRPNEQIGGADPNVFSA
jgi:hypothetical protein